MKTDDNYCSTTMKRITRWRRKRRKGVKKMRNIKQRGQPTLER